VDYNYNNMIEIRAKGPRLLEGTMANLEAEFPIDRKVLWIGRGEELGERGGSQSYVLNLGGLSQAVSRTHACLLLSPSFFYRPQQAYPTFLTRINNIGVLPSHLLVLIWQFLQSPKRILLRDMGSKSGVFRKITRCKIEAGMHVVLGDSRPLIFHNQEIYDSGERLGDRVKELVEKGYVMLNAAEGALSFWLLSFKGLHLILPDRPGRLLIGRSSDCHLAIAEASISRRHAHLEYGENGWHLGDGDGINLSSNGVWVKTRKIWVEYRGADLQCS
jgi:pSer/pThr/pTyr-binding forkhead associated (FHA) protein